MLRNLHVKNLALIDEAEVDFTEGLNILSGETGAGKSIIIGSINLALGEKIPKEMLRTQDENALVELIFDIDSQEIRQKIEEMGILIEEDEIILSRRIVNGRSVAKINGESVPASKMKEVAALLIDIHGQHEHQSLLKKQKHLEILDDYAKEELASVKKDIVKNYQEYRSILKKLKEASGDESSRMRELSLLEYEIHEIEEAALTADEDIVLEQKYKKLANCRKIMEALGISYDALNGCNGSASELIARALRELRAVTEYDDTIGAMAEELSELDNLMNDLNREISGYMDRENFDEEEYVKTERRLDEINHLKSKYGHTIDDILSSLDEKAERAEQLRHFEGYHQDLEKRKTDMEQSLDVLCRKATDIRKKYAAVLTEKVREQLIDLNFLDVRFEMQFEPLTDYSAEGRDEVEFIISTNPGEPLKPLGRVASGGELSRIMLALKTVLAENDKIGALIFDEIDAGISGRTAQKVSEKLHLIAKNHQVICITHLPQIAAMADTHFLIEKSIENQSTISTIQQLSEEACVTELARMLGGVKITDTVLESAKEMLTWHKILKIESLNHSILSHNKKGYDFFISFLYS